MKRLTLNRKLLFIHFFDINEKYHSSILWSKQLEKWANTQVKLFGGSIIISYGSPTKIIYVDYNSNVNGDGTSFDSPYMSLDEAQILESENLVENERSKTFLIKGEINENISFEGWTTDSNYPVTIKGV